MVNTRQILLISPREPSGATWLINCFLELGIRTFRDPPGGMWRREGNTWVLSPNEHILKKWLPILSRKGSFAFRDDLEVRWTHEWPGAVTREQEIVLFVRDPRDALYSRFRREATDLTFGEFLTFPDPWSLLDKIDNWIFFLRSWMECERVHLIRFEDYKVDATATLGKVLEVLRLAVSDTAMGQAVAESTFEKAAAAEVQYRKEHPEDEEVINRRGMPQEWSAVPDLKVEIEEVSRRCGYLLEELGYAPQGDKVPEPEFLQHAKLVRCLEDASFHLANSKGLRLSESGLVGRVFEFAATLTPSYIDRAKLRSYERNQLIEELDRYTDLVHKLVKHNCGQFLPRHPSLFSRARMAFARIFTLRRSLLS